MKSKFEPEDVVVLAIVVLILLSSNIKFVVGSYRKAQLQKACIEKKVNTCKELKP